MGGTGANPERRPQFGLAKYGTPLQANNGRDALKDAYEEALDLLVYLRQALTERQEAAMTAHSTDPAGPNSDPVTDIGSISDGHHTFDELYQHRYALFAAVSQSHPAVAWRSTLHDDGSMYPGMFIAGIDLPTGLVRYHLPADRWHWFAHARTLNRAPEWDGQGAQADLHRLEVALGRSLFTPPGATAHNENRLSLKPDGRPILLLPCDAADVDEGLADLESLLPHYQVVPVAGMRGNALVIQADQ